MDLQATHGAVQEWSASTARHLQQSTSSQTNATSTDSSQFVVVEKSVMYVLAVIAGLVTLLYVLCMYQYLRARLFRRFAHPQQDLPLYSSSAGRTTTGQSSGDEIDRVSCLNDQQRRQVLEDVLLKKIVSSEDLYVAQPVTASKEQPSVEADCTVGTEDTIPVIVQLQVLATATIPSAANRQAPVRIAHVPSQDSQSGVAPSGDRTNQGGVADSEALEVSYECLPVPDSTSAIAVECHVQAHVEERALAEATDDEGSDAATPCAPQASAVCRAESASDEASVPPTGPLPHLPISSAYTYNDDTGDDDDLTGDNLCPICLAGYRVGDVLVSSKHCSHNFHKDCILQWLERNTNCPVCRVEMVTHTEMNQAASVLVGKTRMIRAVATAEQRRPSTTSSSSSTAAVSSRPRPMASGATPPRGVKGPSFGAAMILPRGSYV